MSPRNHEYSPAQLLEMAMIAVSEDDFKAATQFLTAMPSLLANGQIRSAEDLLLVASDKGLKELVEMLLAKGAGINAKTTTGNTALICAAGRGQIEIVEMLLAKGADVNAETATGKTALIFAITNGWNEVVEKLLAKGADINAKTMTGDTALIFAAERGEEQLVEALLAEGADINAKTVDGNTALICAAGRGQIEIVEMLLAKGADPNISNRHDETAAARARKSAVAIESLPIVNALIAHGAYIPGERAPTSEEKAAMTPAQRESYSAAKYARNEVPSQKSQVQL